LKKQLNDQNQRSSEIQKGQEAAVEKLRLEIGDLTNVKIEDAMELAPKTNESELCD